MFQPNAGQCAEPDHKYELHYPSLHEPAEDLRFPCDDHGVVNLDSLSDREKSDYLFARAVVGRDFDLPRVETVATYH